LERKNKWKKEKKRRHREAERGNKDLRGRDENKKGGKEKKR
jgi:hypothetical protein